MINVDSIYLYEDEKTDAMALEKFKQYKTNLETIKEQAEKTVFKDERKSKQHDVKVLSNIRVYAKGRLQPLLTNTIMLNLLF